MTKEMITTETPNWGLMPAAVITQLKKREWDNLPRLKARLKNERAFPIVISLKPPKTGNELLNHTLHFHEFVQAWRNFAFADMVQWQHNSFRHFSEQTLPITLTIPNIQALSEILGASARQQLKDWQKKLSYLHTEIAKGMTMSSANSTNKIADSWHENLFFALIDMLEVVDNLSADDLKLLVALIPQLKKGMGAGLYLRALPVCYVDTKFIETYHKLIETLLEAFYPGQIKEQGLAYWLGCLDKPKGWLMVRPLCPDTRYALSGLPILRLPIHVLHSQALPAKHILVVENEQSCLALPETENTIAVAGGGKNINWMGAGWLQKKTVAYWGDIDSEGLMILSRAREYCPKLTAIMMDDQTIKQFINRMVDEPDSINHEPTHLTHDELTLFTELRRGIYGFKRLEQERLPSEYIKQTLEKWLDKPTPYSL